MTEQTAVVCTCNDEFVIEPCPVHYRDVDSYNGPSVITDELMVKKDQIRQLTGHMFVCPKCNMEAILHFFHYCPNCGTEVLIQSAEVTSFIRKQQEIQP